MLAVGAVAALARDARWNEALARCILANLRTTGVTGFREACIQDQALQERGWQSYWTGQHVQYSPHFQSWLWACNLWAYQQTRFEPLLARSEAGLRHDGGVSRAGGTGACGAEPSNDPGCCCLWPGSSAPTTRPSIDSGCTPSPQTS